MNDVYGHEPLPSWVPWFAEDFYRTLYKNGGFSTPRLADVTEQLFRNPSLQGIWARISLLQMSADGYNHVIGSIIYSSECAPARKRATRDRPDEKIEILERQKDAGKIIKRAAKVARELSSLLEQLEVNGGRMPDEAYSGMALIESAVNADGMARACCAEPLKKLREGLSSYAKSYFPHPAFIVETLANAFNEFPEGGLVFSGDPWLSSQQSSWKDYVRVLSEKLSECNSMYGDSPQLSDADWTILLQTLVDGTLCRQTVSKGLKEL